MRRAALVAALLGALSASCGDAHVTAPAGYDEPIRVPGGQFIEGALPADGAGPRIETIDSQNGHVVAGQAGKKLGGNVQAGAGSIALQIAGAGLGYWVVPVGPEDPTLRGQLTWQLAFDVGRSAPLGKQALALAAVDLSGAFGPLATVPLLVDPLVPSGHVVVALSWDSPGDVDLHLFTPDGKEVSGKKPTTAASGAAAGPHDGVLDRDSNASCVQDGLREEDVVWTDAPAPGRYTVYADLFDACGAPTTDFALTVYVDGAERQRTAGRLIERDASGGVRTDGQSGALGLFVTELSL